ncbi:SigE family RNA polymerase sigma factor [Actinoallomurus sp. CA-150999]|uniref:SigE family RNA polymerase sigma factor n=1 Tax=Actinoallomurus sp. CA-150999 TaxID=3239887 RepID=UPI003D8C7F62
MRDRPEFTAYVEERSPRLVRTAYLLCHDWALAEDLVQTALAKVWRAWRRIGTDPDPYVYKVLVNTHASWWRRRWRSEVPTETVPETPDPADAMSVRDDRAAIHAALRRLPDRQRAVLVLRYFEDLTEAEVARIMGCSVGTVKSQASKALAKLRIDPEFTAPAAIPGGVS